MSEEQWDQYATALGWIRRGWADCVLSCLGASTGQVSIPRLPFIRGIEFAVGPNRAGGGRVARKLHPGIFKFHFESNWFHRWILTRGIDRPLVVTVEPDKDVLFVGDTLRVKIVIQNLTSEPVSIYRMGKGGGCCNKMQWRETPDLVCIHSPEVDWPAPGGITQGKCMCASVNYDGVSGAPFQSDGTPAPFDGKITIDPIHPMELVATFTLCEAPFSGSYALIISGVRENAHF
jgi:hypothetical protein